MRRSPDVILPNTERITMENKDVESAFNGISDLVATLFNAIQAAFELIPPNILGIALIIVGIMWLFRKARHG